MPQRAGLARVRRRRTDGAYAAGVPVGEVIALTFFASSLLATGRSSRDWFWSIAGLGLLGAVILMAVSDGIRPVLAAGPITASTATGALLAGSLFWAKRLGLPRPVARHLGIGLTSRALRFDRRVSELRRPIAEAIRVAQEEPTGRGAVLPSARAHVRWVRAVTAPDADWGALRDDIADGDEASIDLLSSDASDERLAAHVTSVASIATRWQQMREEAARQQRAMWTPGLKRRGEVISLVTLGVAAFLPTIAVASGYDLLALRVADGRFWSIVVGLTVAGGAWTAAVATAVRR